jgi:hypothetical protein
MTTEYRATAAGILSEHSSFTWNKSRTRIRCNSAGCAAVLDAADGEPDAVTAFATHQAEQLPEPPALVPLPAPAPAESEVEPPAQELPAVEEGAASPEADASEQPPAKAAKVRRDTKALTATISELKKGDRVRATFNTPRYGQFTVEGTVLKGGAGLDRNQLSVAGWYINLNERATKALHDLSILAVAGKHEFAIPPVTLLSEHIGIGG